MSCTCGKGGSVKCAACGTISYCGEQHKTAHAETHAKHCANLKIASEKGWHKVVTREGEKGDKPVDGSLCELHYEGQLTNGKVFDASRPKNRTFSFTLGQQEVIQGWDLGVASMNRGEVCTLYLRPDHGYGARGAGGAIPPNAFLIFECELVSWVE